MKRKTLMGLGMVLALGLTAGPAWAQEINGLPVSADEGLAALLAGLGAILAGGTLGNALTEALKRLKWPFLGEGEAARLGGLLAEAAALVISALCGWLALTWLTPLAQRLDQSGLWAVALTAWPVARAWFELRKLREV